VTASMLGEDHQHSRQRQSIITANAELQERELIKMASLATALAGGLRRRGVPDSEASLAAELGLAVFRVAFETWVNGPARRRLATVMRSSFEQMQTLTSASRPPRRSRAAAGR
jgi:hypothetical protein